MPFGQALRLWLKLGLLGFGGPAGQIALMHAELVERRRWISEKRFLHALNYCMLLPEAQAQQQATYMGWLMHGTRGGVWAGVLFVLPSLLILTGLSWLYVVHGQHPVVAGLFYGIKPAVTALVLQAAVRLARACGPPLRRGADRRPHGLRPPMRASAASAWPPCRVRAPRCGCYPWRRCWPARAWPARTRRWRGSSARPRC